MEGETAYAEQPTLARVLIADDHDLVRDGFHRMLSGEPDLQVVGEASNGREAIELGVSDRTQAVVRAIELGLVGPETGQ